MGPRAESLPVAPSEHNVMNGNGTSESSEWQPAILYFVHGNPADVEGVL